MGPGSPPEWRRGGATGSLQPMFANPKARADKPPVVRPAGPKGVAPNAKFQRG